MLPVLPDARAFRCELRPRVSTTCTREVRHDAVCVCVCHACTCRQYSTAAETIIVAPATLSSVGSRPAYDARPTAHTHAQTHTRCHTWTAQEEPSKAETHMHRSHCAYLCLVCAPRRHVHTCSVLAVEGLHVCLVSYSLTSGRGRRRSSTNSGANSAPAAMPTDVAESRPKAVAWLGALDSPTEKAAQANGRTGAQAERWLKQSGWTELRRHVLGVVLGRDGSLMSGRRLFLSSRPRGFHCAQMGRTVLRAPLRGRTGARAVLPAVARCNCSCRSCIAIGWRTQSPSLRGAQAGVAGQSSASARGARCAYPVPLRLCGLNGTLQDPMVCL